MQVAKPCSSRIRQVPYSCKDATQDKLRYLSEVRSLHDMLERVRDAPSADESAGLLPALQG